MELTYTQISQEEAKRIMEEETDYLIIDVRTEEEFKEGHIPGALNIPNETIIDARPSQLPDNAQVLLIYCRSGNRSRQAAQKLADMTRAYFDEGGMEIQYNVVDAATLRKAQENPDDYHNLVVRIAGFSAYFVDMTPEMQQDIIDRAEHTV